MILPGGEGVGHILPDNVQYRKFAWGFTCFNWQLPFELWSSFLQHVWYCPEERKWGIFFLTATQCIFLNQPYFTLLLIEYCPANSWTLEFSFATWFSYFHLCFSMLRHRTDLNIMGGGGHWWIGDLVALSSSASTAAFRYLSMICISWNDVERTHKSSVKFFYSLSWLGQALHCDLIHNLKS